MKTNFPDWGREKLERVALKHAIEISNNAGRARVGAPINRLVVNMLRHEFTDYNDNPSASEHRAACSAVKERYLWLASECDRQIRQRTKEYVRGISLARAGKALQKNSS